MTKPLEISVAEDVRVEDVLVQWGTEKSFSTTNFTVLLVTIVLMLVSAFIGSFLYGLFGFVLSLIIAVVGFILGFRARKTITEKVRVVKETS